jgi:predicted Rdx family selenoprotein
VSLKSELERELGTPVKVKMGRPGALNVYVNGRQVYSYQRGGRYPDAKQLAAAIRGPGNAGPLPSS